jgi:hypothetical protein
VGPENPHSSGTVNIGIGYECSRETEGDLMQGIRVGCLDREDVAVEVADTAVGHCHRFAAEKLLAVVGHCSMFDMSVRQKSSCIADELHEGADIGVSHQAVSSCNHNFALNVVPVQAVALAVVDPPPARHWEEARLDQLSLWHLVG